MKTYYILNPPERVRLLCAELLGEENFHQEIRVTKAKKVHNGSAWECTLKQLRQIHQTALTKGFNVSFEVATQRRTSNTFRFVERYEWHEATMKRKKEAAATRILIATRKKQFGVGFGV